MGIVLAAGLVGVDLDKCIEAGQVQPWAAEVATALDSYTEKSQSGAGLHILAWGTLPPGPRRRGQVEAYDAARFFAMTGDVYGACRTVESRTSELHAMHARLLAATERHKPTAPTTPAPAPTADDAELVRRAMSAKNGARFRELWQGCPDSNGGYSQGDLSLCHLLAYWTGRDAARVDRLFRQSGRYRPKWDARHSADGSTYGQMTLAKVTP